jgi:hypothetical protein
MVLRLLLEQHLQSILEHTIQAKGQVVVVVPASDVPRSVISTYASARIKAALETQRISLGLFTRQHNTTPPNTMPEVTHTIEDQELTLDISASQDKVTATLKSGTIERKTYVFSCRLKDLHCAVLSPGPWCNVTLMAKDTSPVVFEACNRELAWKLSQALDQALEYNATPCYIVRASMSTPTIHVIIVTQHVKKLGFSRTETSIDFTDGTSIGLHFGNDADVDQLQKGMLAGWLSYPKEMALRKKFPEMVAIAYSNAAKRQRSAYE